MLVRMWRRGNRLHTHNSTESPQNAETEPAREPAMALLGTQPEEVESVNLHVRSTVQTAKGWAHPASTTAERTKEAKRGAQAQWDTFQLFFFKAMDLEDSVFTETSQAQRLHDLIYEEAKASGAGAVRRGPGGCWWRNTADRRAGGKERALRLGTSVPVFLQKCHE